LKSVIEKQFILAKLEDGEDVFKSIGNLVKKHDIVSGIILTGIGMLQDFELGYFNGKEYVFKRFEEPMELLSMHGSITTEPELIIHIHVSLGNHNYEVFGGHLKTGIVKTLNEITILKLQDVELTRKLNENTGLMELDPD
jgi:predicted DNA-binding protein with PD1-like motif